MNSLDKYLKKRKEPRSGSNGSMIEPSWKFDRIKLYY